MSPMEALRKRNKARGIKGKDELASEEDLMMHVPFHEQDKKIVYDTCLSISDISERTINELNQEIKKIKNDSRISRLAKEVLIKEAKDGIEKFKGIKKKVKDYCLSEDIRRESDEPGTIGYF